MKYLYLIIATFIVACGAKEDKVQLLKDEVIGIHDEVMPKMGELRSTRLALQASADSLVTTDSISAAKLSSLASDIAAANEGMMQWMRAYEPDFEGTEEEVIAYLETQKIAIIKVKDDMNESLESGKNALDD